MRASALGLAAAVALVVFAALWLSEPTPDPIRPGQRAPGFSLPRLEDGSALSLDELAGEVVLINFWATWCKPCLDEMPAMERLYRSLADRDFALVAISVDEGPDEVREFRDRLDLSFPILLDPGKDVAQAYQSFRFPESYLVGRDGRILSRYIGPRDWDAAVYRERIEQVLDATAAP
ncbi:MAG: TlpA disulfide reductase family protein [Myxococcota bacterium]|nr:TlpA disulfide reductase family protein [Myxococcota bacterium]